MAALLFCAAFTTMGGFAASETLAACTWDVANKAATAIMRKGIMKQPLIVCEAVRLDI
jgi:hypothetical protein